MWNVSEKRGDLLIALALLALGGYWILGSLAMPAGEFSVPGPGFFPALLGALLCVASLGLILQNLSGGRQAGRVALGHAHIWSTLGAMLMYAVLFERIGFVAATTLFLAFLLKRLSPLGYRGAIVVAPAAAMLAYILFTLVLGIRLPEFSWPGR